MTRLKDLLRDNRPVDGIIGSALKVMRRASDAEATAGTIGKQISVVVVPREISEDIRFSYESDVITYDVFLPDILVATSPDMCKWSG